MFTANNVTLRFLEFDDIDTLYSWETDIELAIWSGWIPPLSRAAFRHKYEQRITEPDKDLVMLGIEFEGQLALTVCRRKKNTKDEVLPHILHLSTCQDKHSSLPVYELDPQRRLYRHSDGNRKLLQIGDADIEGADA